MKEIKNVVICGLGAIGTIYAAKISETKDVNLKILADKERINKYTQNPTLFNGKELDFVFVTPQDNTIQADLIILATKNSGLESALLQIKNFVAPDTIILSLLNGIKSEEEISNVYGQDKVLYSYYIGHTSTRTGRNIAHDGVYNTVFGEKNNLKKSDKVLTVANFFDKTGIPYSIPEDMQYSMWWKFLVNVGYNQASALLGASYGDFQRSKKVNDIAIKLMQESVLIAQAEGVKNTEKLIPEVLEVIKTMLPETKTSMLQDIEAKRKTEVEIFAGYLSELGKKHNIPTPYNDICCEIISAMDEKNSLSVI